MSLGGPETTERKRGAKWELSELDASKNELTGISPADLLSTPDGTQHLPGGGYTPLQGSIHFTPGAWTFAEGWPVRWLLGSDLSSSMAQISSHGLLLPCMEADGSV